MQKLKVERDSQRVETSSTLFFNRETLHCRSDGNNEHLNNRSYIIFKKNRKELEIGNLCFIQLYPVIWKYPFVNL